MKTNNLNSPFFWSNAEINDHYATRPNLLLSELSGITGKSVYDLKRILIPDYDHVFPGEKRR